MRIISASNLQQLRSSGQGNNVKSHRSPSRWSLALSDFLLLFSAALWRKHALDWWFLHRGNYPTAVCHDGDLPPRPATVIGSHSARSGSRKGHLFETNTRTKMAISSLVSPTWSPHNKAWSSWAIRVPGDYISSSEFSSIPQPFCYC